MENRGDELGGVDRLFHVDREASLQQPHRVGRARHRGHRDERRPPLAVPLALRHPTPFGRLVAFGMTVLLVLQAGINMAVVLGLLPTKGLALPFVSYGGSAMLGAMTSVGVLLALSRESG